MTVCTVYPSDCILIMYVCVQSLKVFFLPLAFENIHMIAFVQCIVLFVAIEGWYSAACHCVNCCVCSTPHVFVLCPVYVANVYTSHSLHKL